MVNKVNKIKAKAIDQNQKRTKINDIFNTYLWK